MRTTSGWVPLHGEQLIDISVVCCQGSAVVFIVVAVTVLRPSSLGWRLRAVIVKVIGPPNRRKVHLRGGGGVFT